MSHKKQLLSLLIISFPIFLFAQKDSVLIKEASFRYEYQEFELDTINERYMERAAYMGNYNADKFDTVTETVMVVPARVKCIITEPIYKKVIVTKNRDGKKITYEKEILVKKATIKKVEVPPIYDTNTKTVFCCLDGGYQGTRIAIELTETPAKYGTRKKVILKRKTTVKRIKIPAEYKIIE